MMKVNQWKPESKDRMYKNIWRFSSKRYTRQYYYYPILRDLFIERSQSMPEKEFSETKGFVNASENLKRVAKQVADYIQYELGVNGDIVLDYDSDLEEVFIRIKTPFKGNSKKKIELEKHLITKISEKFQTEELWDINIMVE